MEKTEFKGTKGKWIFNETEMKIKGSGDIEGLTVIANVSPKMDFSRGMTTQKANALLISKAPEMLNMLEYINEILDVGLFINKDAFIHKRIQKLIKETTNI
jgi:hypothetical protein